MELDRKSLHIAPMLDVTTRDFRQLMRILSKRAVLWTEMVVDETVVHSKDLDSHLYFPPSQYPIVCQLGGNQPSFARIATQQMVQQYRYDEINLNCECPSNRVCGRRCFGAALMKDVDLAVQMVQAMVKMSTKEVAGNKKAAVVSVKTRIGVDDCDDLEFLQSIILKLQNAGCRRFYIHARKVFSQGLSPAQNRNIPPLNYPRVYQLCRLFPQSQFIINGGISTLHDAKLIAYGTSPFSSSSLSKPNHNNHIKHSVPCDICNAPYGSCLAPPDIAPVNLIGCMMGRAAINDPCIFWDVDRYFYGETDNPCQNRRQVLEKYCAYIEQIYPRQCAVNCQICFHISISCALSRNNESLDPFISKQEDTIEKTTLSSSHPTDKKRQTKNKPTVKIHSHTVDRALRPIMGIFHKLPGSKKFRRTLDQLTRDFNIRDCGPAFILLCAIQTSISSDILDMPFVKTENIIS